MRPHILAVSLLLWGSVIAAHEFHETMGRVPHQWSKRTRATAHTMLQMRIGLRQNNLHLGSALLKEVADPASPKFGQHWSSADVANLFAPSQETVDAVKGWLNQSGIDLGQVSQPASKGWLLFNISIPDAEKLLDAQYHVYEHLESGMDQVACEAYRIHESVKKYVDFVTPTVRLSKRTRRRSSPGSIAPRSLTSAEISSDVLETNSSLPAHFKAFNVEAPAGDISNCSAATTLDCLRALYGIPTATEMSANNSFGVVEFAPNSFGQADLDMFFANYSPALVGKPPVINYINGVQTFTPFGFSESDLDLEYAMALVYPLNVTLFQTGAYTSNGTVAAYANNEDDFLDAIDGTFCSYDGGDNPNYDPTIPSDIKSCGTYAPSNVLSLSYEYDEQDFSAAYAERQCHEYLKLGLQGVTVLFASGDNGVAGQLGAFCQDTRGVWDVFVPLFPSSCPYVTSVGGTQLPVNGTVEDSEIACATVIYSGGGFSNVFPMPDYQTSMVKSWWSNFPPPYTSVQFNNSQETRGFPDISANAANYVVALGGAFGLLYGTSASTPVVAAIITHINDARLKAGKGTVGFINPALYANPGVLNDITEGSNPGCETQGFNASVGWDPVTGLGTPNYPKMLELFLSLP